MEKINSKLILILLIVMLTITGCAGSNTSGKTEGSSSNSEEKQTVIRMGYVPSAGILQLLPIIAMEKGWFDEALEDTNAKVDFIEFKTGPIMMEAFTADELDVGHIGDQPIFSTRANGVDIKAIGLHSQGEKNYGLVVTESSGAKSFKELKGKKIAVTLGSIGQRIFNLYLDKYEMDKNDIEVINIAPSDMKNVLENNDVDAAIIWQPWIGVMEKEKIATQIEDTEGLKLNVNITVATSDFMDKHPEETKKLLEVYLKTAEWVNENQEEASKIVANVMKIDEQIFLEAMKKEQYLVEISEEAIASMADTSKFLEEINVLRKPVLVEECLELKFLKEIGVQ